MNIYIFDIKIKHYKLKTTILTMNPEPEKKDIIFLITGGKFEEVRTYNVE